MKPKLDATQFLEGRERYLDKTPLLQIVEQADQLDDGGPLESFVIGWLDGLIGDIRDCARNAREELAERDPDPWGLKGVGC